MGDDILIVDRHKFIILSGLYYFYFLLKGKYEIIAIVNTTRYKQSKSYKSQYVNQ